jgi:alpha-glucosidase/alpha-D-xyloside xylohydrolase
MPVMRALWLHYSDDPKAVTRGDEFLWGRDLLVAPVVEQGATSRNIYLPRGTWYDFWTRERVQGGREITRAVDLETMPLYVRAGAILPFGPVKQYVDQISDEALALEIYPGNDGAFLLYEDDGRSFDYRRGDWMGIELSWQDASGSLSLQLAPGSKMRPPLRRPIEIKVQGQRQQVEFEGRPLNLRFRT